MILIGLGLAVSLSNASIDPLLSSVELYKKPPVALIRHLEKEPRISFNSIFDFETNNNSAFVAYNSVPSYISSGEDDYMLNSVRCRKSISSSVSIIQRADNLIEDLNYFGYMGEIELNKSVRKKIKVKGKVVSSKRADNTLV
ncbi:hypothetical protein [Clostridium estertheticum]|uniref:hypothetical protein n=1 Tax=Clostridium estertheticum TaxID=238834 RepID=UPI001C7CA824|nr:hypothetical protein [Clostridium estertheticum]MBX4271972.1 hypothetical protein [Clostridium estertheticum]WLC80759.1 hypothetical protein KTC98_05605 [Clostridium estertheticum]